ncbi:hypothetical protein DBR00_03035 [Pseudomonas sp. HMWF032]|uniref:hypothetical protein n=1 Tax=unclassified Pseudomonas TaxID=196821 RepID=UPI000D3692C7|nr:MULTISPECIES: hypothetical protein [unclassified Pseudomonas]PTS84789.1 hypothetical protein DBR00_03035 [Pseudomonas sp. HMWF032]PTT85020.1 hypothetical protein DBR41_05465 [Pseudomonas sp. HMWF010]WAC46232.1 hypothetical protein OU997_08760 [Pseudomonas sp. SL4(2022)]
MNRRQQPHTAYYQLLGLLPFALFASLFAACTIMLMLIGASWRAIEWWREEPSAYHAMDNRTYTRCLRRVDDLYQAARESVRLENASSMASENAYRGWLRQARDFKKHCGPENWPNQAVPQHPADWLPHLGKPKADWPAQVPDSE